MEDFASSLEASRRDTFAGEEELSWESLKYHTYHRFVPLTDYIGSVFRY